METDRTTSARDSVENLRAFLSEYYGRVLQGTGDLEKNACCAASSISRYSEIAELIPSEVKDRNYGCGCCIPADDLEGLTVLDLGSGTGLGCFILSHLDGEGGSVHGIDMTDEQLDIARRNIPGVMAAFGYSENNVFFHKDFMETLGSIEDSTIDLVVSDCAINLSPRKDSVFNSIYRVLKPGGEFYISPTVACLKASAKTRSCLPNVSAGHSTNTTFSTPSPRPASGIPAAYPAAWWKKTSVDSRTAFSQ